MIIKVRLISGLEVEAELDELQFQDNGWFALAVDHVKNPHIPQVINFEECETVTGPAGEDLLGDWRSKAIPNWRTIKKKRLCKGEKDVDGVLTECPKRDFCVRYLYTPEEGEDHHYFELAPFDPKTERCGFLLYPGG